MDKYKVEISALPSQKLTATLGSSTFILSLQWQVTAKVFRVDIADAQGVILTAGRYLLPDINLLAGLYPIPSVDYGNLYLSGEPATPDNLGIDNMLVWSDGI